MGMRTTTESRASRYTRWAVAATCMVGVCVGAGAWAQAEARDADGSRMQARSIRVGSSQRDSLMPPRDRIDWRSFKVSEASEVTVRVSHKPASARLKVVLTDSRGEELDGASARGGSAALSQKLSPGIYYVAVSARARTKYELSVK